MKISMALKMSVPQCFPRGRASFIVIIGLESPPVLIGTDIMRPLRVRIDVTNGTATPAQQDPQTIHLNAAQTQDLPPPAALCCFKPSTSPAKQLAWSVAITRWPSEDVYFCPEGGVPAFVSGVPALTSGSEVWVEIHNHRPEPLRLHTGQTVATLEIVAVASTSRLQPSSPASCPRTPVVHPATAAKGPLPGIQRHCKPGRGRSGLHATPAAHHRDRRTSAPPAVSPPKPRCSTRRDGPGPADVVHASPVVMVKKKDGSLRFCVDFRQLNAATNKGNPATH